MEGKTQRLNGQPFVFKRVSTGAKIGHEARMYSATVKNQGFTVLIYAVAWRYGVVKAALLVGGLAGTVDAVEAVRMAKKQQAHIAAAVS